MNWWINEFVKMKSSEFIILLNKNNHSHNMLGVKYGDFAQCNTIHSLYQEMQSDIFGSWADIR